MAVERVVATMVLDRMTEAVMAEAEMAAEREASGEGGGDGGGGNGKGDGGGELGGGEGGGDGGGGDGRREVVERVAAEKEEVLGRFIDALHRRTCRRT